MVDSVAGKITNYLILCYLKIQAFQLGEHFAKYSFNPPSLWEHTSLQTSSFLLQILQCIVVPALAKHDSKSRSKFS